MPELAINGGAPACKVTWPSWPIWGDEERDRLNEVLESGAWWYGEKVREFEAAFAAFQGAKFGVTATSGTTAIEAALLAIGIGPGDEVIVPPYTFVATATSVMRTGGTPVFADILTDNLCIDPQDVERKITPRTKAIIPVHLAGHMAEMDALGEIATAGGLRIIEDACHAWGSQWQGKGAGTLGGCGVFSFQATKNISSGEGGIIVTNDETLADECRSWTDCGRRKGQAWYDHFLPASNLRMTEFQAALLLAQLTRLDEQTARRAASARILDEQLASVSGVHLIKNDPRITRRAYHFYPFRLRLDELQISRNRFVEALHAECVPASAGYTRPLYENAVFQSRPEYTGVHCPVTEQVCKDTVWILQQHLLADDDAILGIAAAVRKVCENVSELRDA